MSLARITTTILLGVIVACAGSAAPPATAAAAAAAKPPEASPTGVSSAAPAVPGPATGPCTLAENLVNRGDFDAANIAYRQVLENPATPAPDVRSALLGLARSHRLQGSFTKAAAIYERFLQDYPDEPRVPDALLDLGRTLRSMGAYKLAITRFYDVINSALKLNGDSFEHYKLLARTAEFEIAETHFQAGDFAEATKFYTRLRVLDLAPPDRARACFKAGYALRLEGKLDAAAQALQAYVEQYPDDENVPEARYLLALTLRDLGHHEQALAATLELLRTEKSRSARDQQRWAYWQRKTGNQLANDLFETGAIAQAQAIYAALLNLSDTPAWRVPVLYQLGLCDERLGSPDRATANYQALLDTVGKTPAAEFAELARMAAWRIQQLAWTSQVDHQLTKLFDTTTGQPAAKLATAPALAKTP